LKIGQDLTKLCHDRVAHFFETVYVLSCVTDVIWCRHWRPNKLWAG